MLTKVDLLDYLESVGEEGATSWATAEICGGSYSQTLRLLAPAQMGLVKLVRQGLATREVWPGPGERRRKGMSRWIYVYRITPRGRGWPTGGGRRPQPRKGRQRQNGPGSQ